MTCNAQTIHRVTALHRHHGCVAQVDPDEAVAHGAAIEAARLWGMMQPDGRGVIKPHRYPIKVALQIRNSNSKATLAT